MIEFPAIIAYSAAVLCGCLSLACVYVAWFRRQRPIALLILAVTAALMLVESMAIATGERASNSSAIATWHRVQLLALSFLPCAWFLFSLFYARGQGVIGNWRRSIAMVLALPPLVFIFLPHEYIVLGPSSLSSSGTITLGFAGQVIQVMVIAGSVVALMNLERTYRAAVGTLRWRVKYVMLGCATILATRFYNASQALIYGSIAPSIDTISTAAVAISVVLILVGLLRDGSFNIDLYPSHQVISSSITIILAGAYLFTIGLFANAVAYIGIGDTAFPLKALGILVALLILAALTQSDRFRLRIKQFVSRHFRRPKYDYRTLWKRFTDETARPLAQEGICDSIAKLSSETFEALSVSVWLFEENGANLRLQASTILADHRATHEQPSQRDLEGLKASFARDSRPIYLDDNSEPWVQNFARLNPRKFEHGGKRICVPMIARESLLGVVVLGDRVAGIPFSEEEFDVLTSVGYHAASSLLYLRLSRKLIENREMEAFQKMAAFFVHDLKNAASTLGIMVKNLPMHWDNPEFRMDALRGISRTGDRINKLIERLGAVRKDLDIDPRPYEFDSFVQSTLSTWETPPEIEIRSSLNCPSEVPIDTKQVAKVLINLLINANEAMNHSGVIQIETGVEDRQLFLRVKDDGCGMTPEFLEKRLFRPFQTTKQQGIGIGMFQSKMIVEAHGGQLYAESEEGKGTTFTMVLPTSYNQTQ